MKAVTFGEIMLRLQPPSYQRFFQTKSYEAAYGGGEANVAVSLAQFGAEAVYVTALPKNPIGNACVGELRKYGVDTSRINREDGRMGIYFCEKGASQRPSVVIYDRADSCAAKMKPGDFDWDSIFDGVDWFHFSGITPALGDSVADCCKQALKAAKKKGVTVSCDLNFRKKLWTREKAGQVMAELCADTDVLIANEEDCADVFGIRARGSDIAGGVLSADGYADVAKQVCERFGVKQVAITLRESISASVNNWSAMLYDGKEAVFSDKYTMNIVDRVGGGDSFAAGLIYALMDKRSPREAIGFAAAASCLKHSVEGDFNVTSVAEVESLLKNGGSGRVQR